MGKESLVKKPFLPAFAIALAVALLTLCCCASADRSSTSELGASSNYATQGGKAMSPGDLRVSCIDVGKGDCILVQSGAAVALIDSGYKKTSNKVLSYLSEQGVAKIDALVLTHYDKDHVGGFRAIAKALAVDAVYIPEYEGADSNYDETIRAIRDLGLSAQPVTEELKLDLDGAQLSLYPSGVAYVPDAKGDEGNDNDASLVATLAHGKDSYLFAADLEEEGIDAYLRAGHGRFDVLKMPHHGQKGDNTEDFLDDVRPKIALVTDGFDDPVAKKTFKALAKRDVDTYCTSYDGTIVVKSDGAGNYAVTTGGE